VYYLLLGYGNYSRNDRPTFNTVVYVKKAIWGRDVFKSLKNSALLYSIEPRFLNHALDKLVDLLSAVSGFSALQEVDELRLVREPAARAGKLERPQEVVGFLEVRPDSVDFVDEVRTALDSHRSNTFLNDRVVRNGDALFVELAETALEDELFNSGSGGETISHVRLNKTKHSNGGLVHPDEGGVVNLTKAEELHDLLGLGRHADGTPNTDDQGEFGHGRDVEPALSLGLAAVGNGGVIGGLVFCGVLLRGSDGILLVLALLLLRLVRGLLRLSGDFGLRSLLFEDRFRDLECHGEG